MGKHARHKDTTFLEVMKKQKYRNRKVVMVVIVVVVVVVKGFELVDVGMGLYSL
jgi:hypothetical protein